MVVEATLGPDGLYCMMLRVETQRKAGWHHTVGSCPLDPDRAC